MKKIIPSYSEYLNESKNILSFKQTRKDYKSNDFVTFHVMDGDNFMSLKVNNSAGWQTDAHEPSLLKLMDNGNVRGTIRIPNNFKVYDLANKMYNLNSETTWGEKQGLTKDDYTKILQYFLFSFNK